MRVRIAEKWKLARGCVDGRIDGENCAIARRGIAGSFLNYCTRNHAWNEDITHMARIRPNFLRVCPDEIDVGVVAGHSG
jgi:hypothetical protein